MVLDPQRDAQAFFDYSFVELAQHDAPTQIDYVRQRTGKSKIAYIGHSQGTSQMFTALSMNYGGLKDKLNCFVALAPIAYLGHTPNQMISQLAGLWKKALPVAQTLHLFEIKDPAADKAMITFCNTFSSICSGITSFLHLEGSPYNDPEREAVEDYRPDSSASLKELMHYAQLASTGEFKQYDYGNDADNIKHYGSTTVPKIDLGKLTTVPVGLFVGKEDDLGSPTDTRIVNSQIPNVKWYKEYESMDHYSFQIGLNMSYLADVIAFLKSNGNTP